jgi:transcriptional regulator with XRE-family HTH domain
MTTPMNPRLLRRLIALKMIHFRTSAGVTQAEAAKIRGCAQSRIHYIESRRNLPNEQDLRLLLPEYHVEQQTIEEFIRLLPLAKKRTWYDRVPEGILPSWFGDFLAFEEAATTIEKFEGLVVTGLLQTRDYAKALVEVLQPHLKPEEVERRVEVRMRRQAAVLGPGQPEKLRLRVVESEGALRTMVGGAAVHHAQLQHLLEQAENPRVELRVIPASVGAHAALDGGFTILRLPIPNDPGLVYLEDKLRGHYYEDPESVAQFSAIMDRLRRSSMNTTESSVMISTIAKEIA